MPKLPYSGRQTLCHHPLLLSHYPKVLLHGPNDDDGEEAASDRPQCLSQLKQYHAYKTVTKIDNTTCLFYEERFISAKWGFRKLILNLLEQTCFYKTRSNQCFEHASSFSSLPTTWEMRNSAQTALKNRRTIVTQQKIVLFKNGS